MIELLGILNIVSVIFLSWVIASKFFCSLIDRAILTYLLVWADFILTAILLSSFRILDSYIAYFLVSQVLLIILLSLIKLSGLPCSAIGAGREKLKLNSASIVLLFMLAIIFIFNLMTALIYPPNNYDSLTYHLPRIHLYFSQGHLGHFYAVNDRMVFFPLNATLFQFPVVEYGLPDRWFNFINLTSWCVTGFTVFRIILFLRPDFYSAVFGAFLALTGTAVLAQAATTNNDILLASAIAISLYFIFRWIRHSQTFLLLFSILSASIAVGTKVTAVYFFPGIVVVAAVFLISRRQRKILFSCIRNLNFKIVTAFIFVILFFALYSYYINYRDAGMISSKVQSSYINSRQYIRTASQNMIGVALQSALNPIAILSYDFFNIYDSMTGKVYKHAAAYHINRFLNRIYLKEKWDRSLSIGADQWFDNFISRNLVEDEVWFGVGIYIAIFAFFLILAKRRNFKDELPYCLVIFALCLFYFLSYCCLMKWQPWAGRFFVPVYVLMAILAGVVTSYCFASLKLNNQHPTFIRQSEQNTQFPREMQFKAFSFRYWIFLVGHWIFIKKFHNEIAGWAAKTCKYILPILSVVIFFESVSYQFLNQRRPLRDWNYSYSYASDCDFGRLSGYNKVCIVGSSYDQSIYPFMREGKRQRFVLSDKPMEGYYNIIPQNSLNNTNISSDENGLECLGTTDALWYGINL